MSTQPLNLSVKTQIERVPVAFEEVRNALLVKLTPNRSLPVPDTEVEIGLVLDNSGSMMGQPQQDLVRALGTFVRRCRPGDHVAGVAFGSSANTFHPLSNNHARLSAFTDLAYYATHCGASGSTNMEQGIRQAASELLQRGRSARPKTLLLMTDGCADKGAAAMNAARHAVEQGVRIVAMAFGGYDTEFMDQLASLSNDSVWDIDLAGGLDSTFGQRLGAIQDQLATNVVLEMEFLGTHRVLDSYTVSPTTIYNGPVRLGPDRRWTQPLQPVERSQALEILVNVVHPRLSLGTKTLARVNVQYDVPALNLYRQTISRDVSVEYTNDQAITTVDAEVKQRVNDAFLEGQRLRAEAYRQAGDNEAAAKVWGTIKKAAQTDELRHLANGTIKKLLGGQMAEDDVRRAKAGTQKKLHTRNA